MYLHQSIAVALQQERLNEAVLRRYRSMPHRPARRRWTRRRPRTLRAA